MRSMEEMNSISPSVLDSIERLPILSELDETATKMASQLKFSNVVEANCSVISISCSASAGRWDPSPKR